MKIKILSVLLMGILFLTAPSLVLAQTTTMPKNPMTLVHAYKPAVVTHPQSGMVNNAVRARVNNWTNTQQMRLVCVEAMKSSGGNTHLGCLKVNLMEKGSMNGDWAREFDTPVTSLGTGSYKVMYTYQGDQQNQWFPVTALDGSSVTADVTR